MNVEKKSGIPVPDSVALPPIDLDLVIEEEPESFDVLPFPPPLDETDLEEEPRR